MTMIAYRHNSILKWVVITSCCIILYSTISVIFHENVSTNQSTKTTKHVGKGDPAAHYHKQSTSKINVSRIKDDDVLTIGTIVRLKDLLRCNNKDYLRQYIQLGEFWVFKNFARATHGAIPCFSTITFTTHATFDMLKNLIPLAERWDAPVSVAVHAPGNDYEHVINSIRYLRDCLANIYIRKWVTFHIFFSYKHPPPKLDHSTYDCELKAPYDKVKASDSYLKRNHLMYPINIARNIARDAALTHFILAADVNLFPSVYLKSRFLNMIARNDELVSSFSNPKVFIMPAFTAVGGARLPSNKLELQMMLGNKTASPIYTIPEMQMWLDMIETKEINVIRKGRYQSMYWRLGPFFIGTQHDPHYDIRLSWEGRHDRKTQAYIMCVKDYDFLLLNNAFLIHTMSTQAYNWLKDRTKMSEVQFTNIAERLKVEFDHIYGTSTRCSFNDMQSIITKVNYIDQ